MYGITIYRTFAGMVNTEFGDGNKDRAPRASGQCRVSGEGGRVATQPAGHPNARVGGAAAGGDRPFEVGAGGEEEAMTDKYEGGAAPTITGDQLMKHALDMILAHERGQTLPTKGRDIDRQALDFLLVRAEKARAEAIRQLVEKGS